MRSILTLATLFLLSLVIVEFASGQSTDPPKFYFDIGAEYIRTVPRATTLGGGGRGTYLMSFTGLRHISLGKRFSLEIGLGGSIRQLVQFVDNVDRSGRGEGDLVSVDMKSTAILLQVPLQARYYLRPDRRGYFLRAGVSVAGEIWEKTDYFIDREINSSVDYRIRNAVRNNFNPLWRIGLGRQYVGEKFSTHYVELYFLMALGRATARSDRGEFGWSHYWQPARYYSVGISIGGVLGKKQKG